MDAQNPAGYFAENLGPDASYVGMSHFYTSEYMLDTCLQGVCDQNISNSLARSYNFFNHTVAPEPSATAVILGGFNFNHRVGAGFDSEQFNGARGIALNIPGVAAWTRKLLGNAGRNTRQVPNAIPPTFSRDLDTTTVRQLAFSKMTEATPSLFRRSRQKVSLGTSLNR